MKKYKTIETWTRAMQKDKSKKLWADWFNIAGHDYTCEEYDGSGKYMRYTSVTAWQHIDIETSNRYSTTWLQDMTVTAYPIEDLRFDISYYLGTTDIEKLATKVLVQVYNNLIENKLPTHARDLFELSITTLKR